ncbi:MAG TPA: tRNA epoxyqueuosine(34) reductase QueG [Candidatus Hydrogenedens sp.]|nr:tRNA epoxyqueuosine(34) reductase QueG [Candidatus Hydrogenedens sp.]
MTPRTNEFQKPLEEIIKLKAKHLELDLCGIAMVNEVNTVEHLRKWVSFGYHAQMSWFEKSVDIRAEIKRWYPNAESVIVVGKDYYHNCDISQIALYAHTKDYHEDIKSKLNNLATFISTIVDRFEYKISVDTGPIHEKSWAIRAGLGWQGKNTLIINPELGSWFLIGILATNIKLKPDPIVTYECGNCSICIEACPTQAIHREGILDCNKCISYHTIENKSEIPDIIKSKIKTTIFGCDICQRVCPWNKKRKIKTNYDCNLATCLKEKDLYKIGEHEFIELFSELPIKRIEFNGFKRNIAIYQKNKE